MDRVEEIKKLLEQKRKQIENTANGKVEINYSRSEVKISITTFETKNFINN